jgi:hypothetical protein
VGTPCPPYSIHREAIKYRFDGSPLIGPEKRKKKAIRTADCLSVSEFPPFRFFLSIAGSGQSSGSPFLGYLFWRSKKGDSPTGETGAWHTNHIIRRAPHPRPSPGQALTLSRKGRGDYATLSTGWGERRKCHQLYRETPISIGLNTLLSYLST